MTVNETLKIELNPNGTISVYTADGHGIHGDIAFFLDKSDDPVTRVRHLIRNLRTSVEIAGGDSRKPAVLLEAAKSWVGKAVV